MDGAPASAPSRCLERGSTGGLLQVPTKTESHLEKTTKVELKLSFQENWKNIFSPPAR
jgi:hypothetical protein